MSIKIVDVKVARKGIVLDCLVTRCFYSVKRTVFIPPPPKDLFFGDDKQMEYSVFGFIEGVHLRGGEAFWVHNGEDIPMGFNSELRKAIAKFYIDKYCLM